MSLAGLSGNLFFLNNRLVNKLTRLEAETWSTRHAPEVKKNNFVGRHGPV